MLKKTIKGYCVLEKFSKQKGLIHGFSVRKFADCNPAKTGNRQNIEKFLAVLGLERKNLVVMKQVHGNRIRVVQELDSGRTIIGTDGLVTRNVGVVLGVKTADCLPILYFDPVAKIIGAAHAGWRGILKKIPQKMVEVMIRLGSLPENIIVGIGPHIGGCCYDIGSERKEAFEKEFGGLKGMLVNNNNRLYLNLLVPTVNQLVCTGIQAQNIEPGNACTSCQRKDFYSYRKETKKTYGEMLAVIAAY